MKNINKQLYSQLCFQLWDPLELKLYSQLCSQLWEKLYSQIDSKLELQLDRQQKYNI
jgi:hypothetical protein